MVHPAQELARRCIDDEAQALPSPLPVEAAALALALKDEAVAAWGTVPARALRCAALLARLRERDGTALVGAMADWAAGLAALTQGRLAEAGSAFDAAHASLQGLGRHHEAAQTRVPRMIVFSVLGQHDEARACGEAALSAFVAAGDKRSAGKVQLNLGTMLTQRDRNAEAATLFRQAAVRAARAGDRELSIRADIALANALAWQHDFDEALRIDERARMRARTHGFEVLEAQACSAIGRIELLRGHYDRALRTLAQARQRLAQAGASAQHLIDAELALADAYQAVRLLPEARALYSAAIRSAEALEADAERATALLERSRVERQLGETASALAGFEAARALFEAEGNEASQAWAELSIAAVQLDRGDAQSALQGAGDAAARLDSAGIRGWALQARALQASAAAAAGRLEAARALFTQTLAEAEGVAPVRWACHAGLGELAWREGDAARARQHVEAALRGLEQTQALLPGDAFRTAFAADADALHERLVRLALAEGRPPAEVLDAIERGRARALALAIAEAGVAEVDDSAALAALTALNWVRQRRRDALAGGDHEAMNALAGEEAQREHELLEARRRAQLLRTPARAAANVPPAFTAAGAHAALAPGQAVIAFHARGERWLACVVTPQGTQAIALDGAGVEARLRSLRLQLDALRFGGTQRLRGEHGAQLLQRARAHLQALHAVLWAPLASALQGASRVVVVPHGPLHYLPFAALHDGQAWLVERHALSQSPSVAWAVEALAAASTTPRRALALGVGGAGLAHVEAEARAVAACFDDARLLLGAGATQAALREAAAGTDVLHLACHAHFRADNPLFSALELADGPLALHATPSLGLQAQLVTLSACETGVSRLAPGNEAIGLVRGFLLAGVRTVLASAWAVDDAATAELMREFYRRLRGGEAAPAALAGAQRRMAEAGTHPFHWAAFALHGRG